MQSPKRESSDLIFQAAIIIIFGITTLIFYQQAFNMVEHFFYVMNDGLHQISGEPLRHFGH